MVYQLARPNNSSRDFNFFTMCTHRWEIAKQSLSCIRTFRDTSMNKFCVELKCFTVVGLAVRFMFNDKGESESFLQKFKSIFQ